MSRFFSRSFFSILLACMVGVAPAQSAPEPAAEPAVESLAANSPPSARLDYSINASQRGLSLSGTAILHWNNHKNHYTIATETRAALLGKILEAKSEGSIDASGLLPATSSEKRFRKDMTITTFNRESSSITFSASDASYPITGGEQDRNSVVWQLATMARSQSAKFKSGASISMLVAGSKDMDDWSFMVGETETIKTALGDLKAVKISKLNKDGDKKQKIDIWLAPSKEWYPVRIRFTEPDGDFIEQTISNITPHP